MLFLRKCIKQRNFVVSFVGFTDEVNCDVKNGKHASLSTFSSSSIRTGKCGICKNLPII